MLSFRGTMEILYGSTREGGTTSLYGTLYEVSFSPALPAPVQLSLSKSQIALGSSATLSWKVLNAYSTTMQQCYAFVQDSAAGAGTWSGKQAGTYSSSMRLFTGTSTITPTAHGNYTYALTCGGQESGFATLTVPGQVSTTALTASPASPSVGQQVDSLCYRHRLTNYAHRLRHLLRRRRLPRLRQTQRLRRRLTHRIVQWNSARLLPHHCDLLR